MFRSARRPSAALVLAAIALFVSLGGVGAAATGMFSGRQIANHTIPLSKLTPSALQLLQARPNHVTTDTGDKFSLAAGTVTGSIAWTDTPGLKGKRMASGIYEILVPNGTFKASSPLAILGTGGAAVAHTPELCTAKPDMSTSTGLATVTLECVKVTGGTPVPTDTAFSIEIAGPPPG